MQIPLTATQVKQQLIELKASELASFADADINELIRQRSQYYDQLLAQLWQQFGLAQTNLALLAVGGYGRAEMFPLSDLDILILSAHALSESQQQQISQLIQFLWDCHLEVGHSVRTLAECIDEGKQDISIATNLLEARLLQGKETLYQQFSQQLRAADFWPIADFFTGKIQEQTERYQRYHNTGYNLEPDVKYSPGGLRDLHLLYWLTLRHFGVNDLQQILHSGFIYPEEFNTLYEAQQFLFHLRFALHLVIKRLDNRLLFERQVKVSEMLGYQEGDDLAYKNKSVETMMRVFFKHARNVASLTQLLAKHYYEHFIISGKPITDESIRARSAVYLDNHFVLQGNSLQLTEPRTFLEKPETILDLFLHLTEHTDAEIHSSTLRHLYLALSQLKISLSSLPIARTKFIRLLTHPKGIERGIRAMHQHGVLSAYLAAWQSITGLMQFDLFHVYTVDEHTVRVLEKLASFLVEDNREHHPLCVPLFQAMSHANRTLLYITALFHDIAKGRGGDHAELGAIDVYEFAFQHGFSTEECETMAWLVQNHLKMSVVAQRRDIYDPEVVLEFASSVKTQARLDYLLCLTVADICATNNQLWNSWKRTLLSSLHQLTTQQLICGFDQVIDIHDQLLSNRLSALAELNPSLVSGTLKLTQINAFWQRCPRDYFLRNNPKQIAWHTELVCFAQEEVIVKVSNRFSLGGTELFVYCPDQPKLFHHIAKVIEAKKLSIHDAQILTTDDNYAIDSFIITENSGALADYQRRRALELAVYQALKGQYYPSIPKARVALSHFHVPTEVRFINLGRHQQQTEIEIFTLDQAGLLATISQVFSELGLNLLNAKIITVGEKAEDFFIVQNQYKQALTDAEREQLKLALLTALN